MTVGNVVVYLALIVYVLARKVKGRPVGTPKRLLLLPVVLIVVGYRDVNHGTMKAADVAATVVGAALSLGLGALRGRSDKLSVRDDSPYVQWGAASLLLFGVTILTKLVVDIAGVAAGGTAAGAERSLILSVGLTLAGEAMVLIARTGAAGLTVQPRRVRDSRR